ncbi:MAG: beta/gamma crystallin-related protein [Rothia sp. (in: high G+C Gram-positive bacteria)]|uniref:beta/gamma crystallin-related protein n=1 Tax=Rothia sp. (in: high G+C Gram-positive bacteria) TaxID=1885016 RepID=UPI0026E0D511|nr:beta/gamma crystallin-related protein [Rothia sp. (in: high G+C Gram-positive bacteria)]MDO5749689.1 beta/gamma crystallin-related protein [Rothia sp. (in: high G+C Gram-positive bacteria)]
MHALKSLFAGAAAVALLLTSVPPSSAAQFYDHAGYQGENYDSRGSSVFYFEHMNDRISSIRSWGENYILYQDYGYSGHYKVTGRDDYYDLYWHNGADNTILYVPWNDAISSAARIWDR